MLIEQIIDFELKGPGSPAVHVLLQLSSGLRNVQMHRGPHLTYRAQKKFDYEKL